MKQLMLFIFSLFILVACNSSRTAEVNEDLDKTFFPIAGTIQSELREIDSLPIAIIRYTRMGDHSDTTVFDKNSMKILVDELIKPDISQPDLKKYYKETVFMDDATNTVTMSYTTEADEPEVRKIEVTINPENQKVRTIYVEKFKDLADSSIQQKMIWTCGRNLQVISLVNKKDKGETLKTEKYVWGIN